MKNVKTNIKAGQGSAFGPNGFDLARKIADEAEKETGNRHVVERILDYTDSYNSEPRYHYSFDVIEIIND